MKILVGMSGGVDSAFAASRLIEHGDSVEGAVLLMHEYTEVNEAGNCAEELGIRLHTVDARNSFNYIIKENFACEYAAGRTPNPCILCNERVKFRVLLDYALENGFDAIATGHYARVVRVEDAHGARYAIGMAADARKDQSYMLYRLPQDILSHLVLPLADITKEEVRALAGNSGIAAADRPDSQEICFLPDGGYADFVESVKGSFAEGNFVDVDGRILGKHKGIVNYTVGQRKGLGISLGERAFVTKIDPVKNEITLSPDYVGVRRIWLRDTAFSGLPELALGESVRLQARVRYKAPLADAIVKMEADGEVSVSFDQHVKAAPGQSCVLYSEGIVMLGGVIEIH